MAPAVKGLEFIGMLGTRGVETEAGNQVKAGLVICAPHFQVSPESWGTQEVGNGPGNELFEGLDSCGGVTVAETPLNEYHEPTTALILGLQHEHNRSVLPP